MVRTAMTAALAIAISAFGSAHTAIIAAGSATSGAGTGPAANALLTSFSIATPAPGNIDGPGGGPSPNVVTLELDVYAMDPGSSFAVDFVVSDGVGEQGTTEYLFLVTLTNALGDNGVDPGDAGKEINGLDVELTPGPFALTGFDPIPAPGIAAPLPTFPLQFGGPAGTALRWGGLSGGGGGVPYGTSQTFVFNVDILDAPGGIIGDSAGTLSVVFTANPEPTTLLLGGLAYGFVNGRLIVGVPISLSDLITNDQKGDDEAKNDR